MPKPSGEAKLIPVRVSRTGAVSAKPADIVKSPRVQAGIAAIERIRLARQKASADDGRQASPKAECPFCHMPTRRILTRGLYGYAVRDGFPVSPGHTLVIAKRHVSSFFELTAAERSELLELLVAARAELQREFHPDGYNVGINDGVAAGQTIPHVHIHLIPRYAGDREDPRGGVRWVLPDRAKHWD